MFRPFPQTFAAFPARPCCSRPSSSGTSVFPAFAGGRDQEVLTTLSPSFLTLTVWGSNACCSACPPLPPTWLHVTFSVLAKELEAEVSWVGLTKTGFGKVLEAPSAFCPLILPGTWTQCYRESGYCLNLRTKATCQGEQSKSRWSLKSHGHLKGWQELWPAYLWACRYIRKIHLLFAYVTANRFLYVDSNVILTDTNRK